MVLSFVVPVEPAVDSESIFGVTTSRLGGFNLVISESYTRSLSPSRSLRVTHTQNSLSPSPSLSLSLSLSPSHSLFLCLSVSQVSPTVADTGTLVDLVDDTGSVAGDDGVTDTVTVLVVSVPDSLTRTIAAET